MKVFFVFLFSFRLLSVVSSIEIPKACLIKKIEIKDTIKTLGTITINIKLYEGIIGNLKVDVISA